MRDSYPFVEPRNQASLSVFHREYENGNVSSALSRELESTLILHRVEPAQKAFWMHNGVKVKSGKATFSQESRNLRAVSRILP